MTKYHEKMFRIMNQFRKLNISDMLPGISRMEYLTMLIAMKAEDDRRISVSELIKDSFCDKVFHTFIRDNVTLAEAPVRGKDVFAYNSKCNGANDYMEFAKEILAL